MGLFTRKKVAAPSMALPIRVEAAALLEGQGSPSPWDTDDGGFALRQWLREMWGLNALSSTKVLSAFGLSADDFYEEAMLTEQYDAADLDERAKRLAQAMQWSNMLDGRNYSDARLLAMHATMRLKALALAVACDTQYDTDFLQRIAIDPDAFGVHRPGEAQG